MSLQQRYQKVRKRKRKYPHKEQVQINLKLQAKTDQPQASKPLEQNQSQRRMRQRRQATNILQQAENLIYGPRNADYGHPTDNFRNIANLWAAYLEAKEQRPFPIRALNNLDVANLNILQKIARLATNQTHLDSIMDISGYAGCQERIIKNK